MKSLTYGTCLFLIFVVLQAQAEDSVTLDVRVDAEANQFDKIWIGVFDLPAQPGAEARNWTEVEYPEIALNAPDVSELQIVALRKDFLPLIQRVNPQSDNARIDLEFQIGNALEGSVLSTDGIPVAGVYLTVERDDLPNVRIPDHVKLSWTSDAEGQFKIGGLAGNENYKIEANTQFAGDEAFSVRMPENGNHRRDLRLSNAFFVLGRVVDLERAPVLDATVKFQLIPEEWEMTAATNAEGKFALGPFVQNKEMWLSARQNERGSSKNFKATSGEHDVELILHSMVQVIGTVVDASTREPIDDFTLLAVRADGSRKYPHVDSNGQIFSAVDPVTTALIVHSEKHNAHFVTDLLLESVAEHDLGEIALSPGRELSGQVYDAATGEPVVGAMVSLVDSDWIENVGDQWLGFLRNFLRDTIRSTTNQKGEYLLKPLPADSVNVTARAWGYQYQSLPVDESAAVLDIALTPNDALKTRIRGRIDSPDGNPVEGWLVLLGDSRNTGGHVDDGLFDVPVYAGTYDVYAITDLGRTNSVRVTVNNDETQEVILVVESKGLVMGTIHGLWNDETADLGIYSETDGLGVSGVTGIENGDFQIPGVGYGEFRLKASSNRGREQEILFELNAENGEAFVELHFSGSSRLYGSLGFPDGSVPIGKVKAIAKQSGKTTSTCEINDDGTYEIKGLDDGEYTLRIWESTKYMVTRDDGSRFGGSTSTPIKDVDIVVRGDTEHNIQLSPQSDTE